MVTSHEYHMMDAWWLMNLNPRMGSTITDLGSTITDIGSANTRNLLLRPWIVARVMDNCKSAETQDVKGDDKCCMVCQDDFESGDSGASGEADTSLKLSCGHMFHDNCLIKWLSPAPKGGHGNACPACRIKLFGA